MEDADKNDVSVLDQSADTSKEQFGCPSVDGSQAKKRLLNKSANASNIQDSIHEFPDLKSLCKARWSAIAVVLDRFFLLMYLVALTVSMVFLFPRPQYDIN